MLPMVQFFWDRRLKSEDRARFSLLSLEYGEVFVEDFSVYAFPPFTEDVTDFSLIEPLKVKGRLKMCSRSLIFEPADPSKPLLKYAFKQMTTDVDIYRLRDELVCSVKSAGFIAFASNSYSKMKENGRVGPHSLIKCGGLASRTGNQSLFLFALLHADAEQFVSKVIELRRLLKYQSGLISTIDQLGGPLLDPMLNSRSVFDSSSLVDFHETLLLKKTVAVKRIRPLLAIPGVLMVTEKRLYYQPAQLNNVSEKFQYFDLNRVERILRRRYLLQPLGLEFSMQDGSSVLFVFDNNAERDRIYGIVAANCPAQTCSTSESVKSAMHRWQRREISNFDYLMLLNREADRSPNDLTQYPVFPHIIADYTSTTLDFSKPQTFRDLWKPVGALNPDRLSFFTERMRSMPPADIRNGIPPPFLYGTHYSTPGYVLFFLVRVAPEHMLCLQNGKFDAADRLFHSMADMYSSCLTNPADLKELIPEFFCGDGEFLTNSDGLDLGYKQNGDRVSDVVLPPWAVDPSDFIQKQRQALESEYVSANLHKWIDLVFGCKQRGQRAVEANNLFYYLTYEGSVDLEAVADPSERASLEVQIQEFGQTPTQLFGYLHPSRNATVGDTDPSNYDNNNDNDNDVVDVARIRLGDDFKAEVARELRLQQQQQQQGHNENRPSSPGTGAGKTSIVVHPLFPPPLPPLPSLPSSSSSGKKGGGNGGNNNSNGAIISTSYNNSNGRLPFTPHSPPPLSYNNCNSNSISNSNSNADFAGSYDSNSRSTASPTATTANKALQSVATRIQGVWGSISGKFNSSRPPS